MPAPRDMPRKAGGAAAAAIHASSKADRQQFRVKTLAQSLHGETGGQADFSWGGEEGEGMQHNKWANYDLEMGVAIIALVVMYVGSLI